MNKFAPGDLVIVTDKTSHGRHAATDTKKLCGLVGIVRTASPDSSYWGIEFLVNVGGHNCGGACKPGQGWSLNHSCLEKLYLISEIVKHTTA